jgi:hypothetical protein
MIAEPKVRERFYKRTLFVCDECGGERGTVYSRVGRWHCLACLRVAIKRAGGKREQVWCAALNAEAGRCAPSRFVRLDFPR